MIKEASVSIFASSPALWLFFLFVFIYIFFQCSFSCALLGERKKGKLMLVFYHCALLSFLNVKKERGKKKNLVMSHYENDSFCSSYFLEHHSPDCPSLCASISIFVDKMLYKTKPRIMTYIEVDGNSAPAFSAHVEQRLKGCSMSSPHLIVTQLLLGLEFSKILQESSSGVLTAASFSLHIPLSYAVLILESTSMCSRQEDILKKTSSIN